jgi:hypothetical protein
MFSFILGFILVATFAQRAIRTATRFYPLPTIVSVQLVR